MQALTETEVFINAFEIHEPPTNSTVDLINIKAFLAKKSDESSQFVMTDTQQYQLVLDIPASPEEFEALFDRMSFNLRLHFGNFLLKSPHKPKVTSIENIEIQK